MMAANMSITLLLVLYFMLPKIESISQGPAIDFYKQIAKEDCYVDVYGFKSHAHFFYSEIPEYENKLGHDKDWLLNGAIDKPVYFVTKYTKRELDTRTDINFLYQKGGFKFYKRMLLLNNAEE